MRIEAPQRPTSLPHLVAVEELEQWRPVPPDANQGAAQRRTNGEAAASTSPALARSSLGHAALGALTGGRICRRCEGCAMNEWLSSELVPAHFGGCRALYWRSSLPHRRGGHLLFLRLTERDAGLSLDEGTFSSLTPRQQPRTRLVEGPGHHSVTPLGQPAS
ncbi:hypothetical protein MRX96_007408 [Rhipicephalus microplus]